MRQLVRLTGIVVGLVVMGCGSGQWIHPEKPKDEFATDYRECEQRIATDPKMQQGNRFIEVTAVENCVKKMGWVYYVPE